MVSSADYLEIFHFYKDNQPNRARLGDAYEEALYGSDGSSDDESEEENNPKGKRNHKMTRKSEISTYQGLDNNLLEDDEDEIMNLLDGGRMTNRAMGQSFLSSLQELIKFNNFFNLLLNFSRWKTS